MRPGVFIAFAVLGAACVYLRRKPRKYDPHQRAYGDLPFVPAGGFLSFPAAGNLGAGALRLSARPAFYPDLSRFALANDRTRHLCLCGCKRDCGVILTIEHGPENGNA